MFEDVRSMGPRQYAAASWMGQGSPRVWIEAHVSEQVIQSIEQPIQMHNHLLARHAWARRTQQTRWGSK
jgi:hypothetical protein